MYRLRRPRRCRGGILHPRLLRETIIRMYEGRTFAACQPESVAGHASRALWADAVPRALWLTSRARRVLELLQVRRRKNIHPWRRLPQPHLIISTARSPYEYLYRNMSLDRKEERLPSLFIGDTLNYSGRPSTTSRSVSMSQMSVAGRVAHKMPITRRLVWHFFAHSSRSNGVAECLVAKPLPGE